MIFGCAVCTVFAAAALAVFGYFDITVLTGSAVGYLLAVGNFFFMAVGVIKALETGDEDAAKLKMRLSYTGRTVVMIFVIAVSVAVEYIHWLPVFLSLFYPRVVITVRNIASAYVLKKHESGVRRLWK